MTRKASPQGSGREEKPYEYFTTYSSPKLMAFQYGLYAPRIERAGNELRLFAAPAATGKEPEGQIAMQLKGANTLTGRELQQAVKQHYTEGDHLFIAYFLHKLHELNGHRHRQPDAKAKAELQLSFSEFASFSGKDSAAARRTAKHGLKALQAFGFIVSYPANFNASKGRAGLFMVQVNARAAGSFMRHAFWINLPKALFSDLSAPAHARAVYCYLAEVQHRNIKGWNEGKEQALKVSALIAHTPLARYQWKHTSRKLRTPLEAALTFLQKCCFITWCYESTNLPFKQRTILYNANAEQIKDRAKKSTFTPNIVQKSPLLAKNREEKSTCTPEEPLKNAGFHNHEPDNIDLIDLIEGTGLRCARPPLYTEIMQ